VDPSKSVSATPGIIGPVEQAELQLNKYARPVIRSLFNIAQFPKTASCCFLVFTESFPVYQNPKSYFQKRTARLSPAVQVREETPWGQRQRGALADRVLQIKKARAVTGLNLCSRFICSRYIYTVDASYRDADHVGGHPHDSRIN
jgi:hypothetical protein